MIDSELERGLERLHDRSFAWALACCGGDRQEAEDVLQSTYLKVLDGKARYAGRSSLKTWLFAVIRRTAVSRRRRRLSRRWLLERWGRSQRDRTASERSDARAELSEQADHVRRALGALSRRQRQVLELVFYHQLSLAEAAEILGVSLGTVSSHYARGKAALERSLD